MTPPPFHLRRAIASDLEAILTLERATDLAPHWPPSAYSEILAAPMGTSGEGYESGAPSIALGARSIALGARSIALGAPSIPRSLRNGWETASPTSGRIDSDALQLTNKIQRCLFVAEKNGSLAGFAVGLLHPATRDPAVPDARQRIAELESVVVSANARRAGIGRALCRAVLDWTCSQGTTELVLEVRAASSAAIALYANLGFTLAARRPRYYRDPNDDALLMRLQLE
jgi:GNAT superfamily N-acetyltransferase